MARQPRPTEGLKGQDLGDEYLFYDGAGDRVHVLNSTAREIYLLCDGTRAADELAASLVERYGIDVETARRDLDETLKHLYELGLLQG